MMLPRRPFTRYNVEASLNSWLPFLLIVLLVLYWLFARSLERIDLTPVLDRWWQVWLPLTPAPGIIVFLAEMLHPRVLRHLIPVLVGWLLANGAAVNLVQALYDLPDVETGKHFLAQLRASGLVGSPVTLNAQTLAADREQELLLRVGGPGLVIVTNGDAAVTELNGRFHRVLGAGTHRLGSFETVYAVLDLRQQERTATDVPVITRDGIELTVSITITFRISAAGESPTRSRPYPYDEESVRLVAYAETVMADGAVSTWETIPLNVAKGEITKTVFKYRLDDILAPQLSSEPVFTIRREVERKVQSALSNIGIELTGFHIAGVELPEAVSEQYIKFWQTHWETQIRLSQADGEAKTLEELETARIEAELTMIQAIVEGVHRVQRDGRVGNLRQVIALRLVEALEKMARQTQQVQPLPQDLLPYLENLRLQLLPATIPPRSEGTGE